MKRKHAFLKYALPVVLVLCLSAAGYIYAVQRSAQQMEVPVTEPAATENTEPSETTVETTEPPVVGELYLTVSEITFSLVGDREAIYAGTVPLEQITWTSGDDSIIEVQDGILTAVGVGSTTVTASCEGQEISCQAACLAETKEDLLALPYTVLREPQRLPPQVGDEVLSFYEDAVMLGDSITYGFMKYEARNGRLGSPRCLCRGSLGIRNLLTHNLDLYYQGAPTPLEDVLASVAPQKVFILLGTNDVMVRPADTVLSELDELLNRVLEKSPDLEIYLQSVFPIVNENRNGNSINERIFAYNEALEAFAAEKNYHYVPITPYLVDHGPAFAHAYQQDTYHPSYEGVCAWVDALRSYAYIQQLKGE